MKFSKEEEELFETLVEIQADCFFFFQFQNLFVMIVVLLRYVRVPMNPSLPNGSSVTTLILSVSQIN
jgi:hypothetical protein